MWWEWFEAAFLKGSWPGKGGVQCVSEVDGKATSGFDLNAAFHALIACFYAIHYTSASLKSHAYLSTIQGEPCTKQRQHSGTAALESKDRAQDTGYAQCYLLAIW